MQGGVHINRLQKRKMMKKLGVDFHTMNLINDAMEHEARTLLVPGDKVQINVDQIMAKPDFKNMLPTYQDFVKGSIGKTYTVIKEERFVGRPIVSLDEDPAEVKWLFWEGDLILCEANSNEEG